jgi:hypothetical protein
MPRTCSPASVRSPWQCAGACIGDWASRRTSYSSKRVPMYRGPTRSGGEAVGWRKTRYMTARFLRPPLSTGDGLHRLRLHTLRPAAWPCATQRPCPLRQLPEAGPMDSMCVRCARVGYAARWADRFDTGGQGSVPCRAFPRCRGYTGSSLRPAPTS